MHATRGVREVQQERRGPSRARKPVLPLPENRSLRDTMKDNPIGSIRLAALLAGALILGAALAKANPGKMNYASAGAGSTTHLAADHFARLAGVQMVHVPYKGTGPALADLVAGRVQMLSVGLSPVQAHLKSGALKALAAASKTRLAALPQVPTSAEAGLPGYEMTTWFGIFAPKGTSPAIVRLVNSKMQAVIDDSKARQRLLESGIVPIGGSVEAFAELVRSDTRAWERVVRASGVKLD